jgi:hypothetical protein
MTEFYLFLLFALVGVILARVATRPACIFEYPYFMAAVFAVFVLPQAYSLANFPGGVSKDDVDNVLLMSVLCLACAYIGYSFRPSETANRMFAQPVDTSRLFITGMGLIFVGLAATVLLPRGEVRTAERGGLTGIATIYLFFSSLTLPGFAICVRLLQEQFTRSRLFVVILGGLVPLYSVVVSGRREVAVTFALAIALSRFYKTRKPPGRLLIFGSLFFAMVAIPATGTYRGIMERGKIDLVTQIRPIENFVDFFTQESILELRNAAALMNSTKIRDSYGWGRGYWNQMVFRFVPAQILSREFKDGLMIGEGSSRKIYATELANNYEISAGSTNTGMGDAYEQFGWFGCFFFALLGMFFKTLWTTTMVRNSVFPQVFYIMICSSAMRTVTHQTVDFFPGMVYQLIFLGMGYVYAKIPQRDLLLSAQGRYRGMRRR